MTMGISSLREKLHTFAAFPQTTSGAIVAGTVVILTTVTLLYLFRKLRSGKNPEQDQKLPPHIPSPIPYIGHAVAFGKNPVNFLMKAYKEYGCIFSFTMFGKTFTYVIGPRPCAVFFKSKNEDLNIEEVYTKLVTPVFGKGVIYDVPCKVFMEQRKMVKAGLSIAHLRRYVPLIEKETNEYFERWGDSGERDLLLALSELFIFTASRCLHGKEIREQLDEHVAQLYRDMGGGLNYLAWLLPEWLPLQSFRKRDKARLEMSNIFGEIIRKRRENPDEDYEDDILNTLMHASYKDGRQVTDEEITGLLISALLAGQHTSSTICSWLGFFLAKEKKLQDQAYAEQITVRGEGLLPLEYDQLKQLEFLDRCLKETLRLRSPSTTLMRMVKTPQVIQGFTVPVGHHLCVSPNINQRLEEMWEEPESFNPDRFLDTYPAEREKYAFIPFGAGRHRCVGEAFSYVQIMTIWSVLLQKYEFELVDGHFPPVNYSTIVQSLTKPIIKYKRR